MAGAAGNHLVDSALSRFGELRVDAADLEYALDVIAERLDFTQADLRV